jgi:hypothetical protein
MTMTKPRFSRTAGTWARCLGTNHRDEAEIGECATCLMPIVKLTKNDKTRLLDLVGRFNANDRRVEDYACWQPSHTCDEQRVLLVQAERDAKIAAGVTNVIGADVIVVRGRKIPQGTRGIVFWLKSEFGWDGTPFSKLGIRDAEGNAHFVRDDYVISANDYVMPEAEEDRMDAQLGKGRSRPTGSHAGCTHAATPKDRAICRKTRAR